ncbi:hypothetical protein HH303_15765 [Rhodospirillaceae bacterium KN72]|uniref:Uncharacterized protein n=1 Tax=Pacificispira spongiicola TaxID=2729598 RepID=A0A7Y0E2C2_9PROT|nr:hypothetical protein [Pacificispira spongiicola]NMM45955.1 hypothetical protein [Pacificispira spongiicola]
MPFQKPRPGALREQQTEAAGNSQSALASRENTLSANLNQLFASLHDPTSTERGRKRLGQLGLRNLAHAVRGPQLCAVGNVRPDGKRFAIDHDGGLPALVVAAWDRPCPLDDGLPGWAESLDDLVAFSPDRPEKWWTMAGGNILGGFWLERASYLDEPALIHDRPIDWLRAGGFGSVVLDWDAPPILTLSTLRRIVSRSERTAARIARALTRPVSIPEIRVNREVLNVAAA